MPGSVLGARTELNTPRASRDARKYRSHTLCVKWHRGDTQRLRDRVPVTGVGEHREAGCRGPPWAGRAAHKDPRREGGPKPAASRLQSPSSAPVSPDRPRRPFQVPLPRVLLRSEVRELTATQERPEPTPWLSARPPASLPVIALTQEQTRPGNSVINLSRAFLLCRVLALSLPPDPPCLPSVPTLLRGLPSQQAAPSPGWVSSEGSTETSEPGSPQVRRQQAVPTAGPPSRLPPPELLIFPRGNPASVSLDCTERVPG